MDIIKMERKELLSMVDDYYSDKIKQFGITPNGVDWNSLEGQVLRFEQLAKIIEKDKNFSICDIGCGYGAFLDFLVENYKHFNYLGVDVSEDMINAAVEQHEFKSYAAFTNKIDSELVFDFVVASGIFNVRLQYTDDDWYEYIKETIELLDSNSKLGFAFNCLTKYSDESKKRDYLYYADPCKLFDLCKKLYSNNVALLHDYGLYEFTILVRKL